MARFFMFVVLAVLSMSNIAKADDTVPPLPYMVEGEQVFMHGMPGDDDYYETHVRFDGMLYFTDADGNLYFNKEDLRVSLNLEEGK